MASMARLKRSVSLLIASSIGVLMLPFSLYPRTCKRLVLAAVGQAVNQPGITVEVENDRLVGGEQRIEIRIGQPVRMFRARLQLEKVDHVNETDLQVREFLAQQHRCGQAPPASGYRRRKP